MPQETVISLHSHETSKFKNEGQPETLLGVSREEFLAPEEGTRRRESHGQEESHPLTPEEIITLLSNVARWEVMMFGDDLVLTAKLEERDQ